VEAARRIVFQATSADAAKRLHRGAATYYRLIRGSAPPSGLDDAKAGLEEVFHLVASCDVDAAAHVLWWAGSALLRWGYTDIVEREALGVAAAADTATATAYSAFFIGEVADLRGRYDEAAA
jgi:hypothetical protein